MRLTQGTFSFLPDLTDEQINKQLTYAMEQGWAVNIEYTDDEHSFTSQSKITLLLVLLILTLIIVFTGLKL